jgi:hypothetical protein
MDQLLPGFGRSSVKKGRKVTNVIHHLRKNQSHRGYFHKSPQDVRQVNWKNPDAVVMAFPPPPSQHQKSDSTCFVIFGKVTIFRRTFACVWIIAKAAQEQEARNANLNGMQRQQNESRHRRAGCNLTTPGIETRPMTAIMLMVGIMALLSAFVTIVCGEFIRCTGAEGLFSHACKQYFVEGKTSKHKAKQESNVRYTSYDMGEEECGWASQRYLVVCVCGCVGVRLFV